MNVAETWDIVKATISVMMPVMMPVARIVSNGGGEY